MTSSLTYSVAAGDYRLTRLTKCATDGAIEALVRDGRVAAAGIDPATLLQFVRRAAAYAVRTSDPRWCEAGLAALRQLDVSALDPRDVRWAGALLLHGAGATSEENRILWAREVPAMPDPVSQWLASLSDAHDDLSDWGYRIVNIDGGHSLMRWGAQPYATTCDLVGLSLDVARQLDDGRYVVEDPEGGSDIPGVWFVPHASLLRRLNRLRGCITLHAVMRSDLREDESAPNQLLILFLAETPNEHDAGWLGSQVRTELTGRLVAATARGRVLAVLVVGSFCKGVATSETPSGIREIMALVETSLDHLKA